MRTIVGEDDLGEFLIQVSDTCKMTYGPNVPYAAKGEAKSIGRLEGYALRVYEGEKLQACFTNVKWFRDKTISMQRVVEKVTSQIVYKDADTGGYSRQETVAVDRMLTSSKIESVDVTPTKKKRK